jgi:3-oxoacyl-[acyl-carrier protein] reductase
MDLGLTGKSVLITGASKGIGFGIAQTFAAEGARVTICGRNEKDLRATVEQLQEEGADALGVPADVTKLADLQRLFDRTMEHRGAVDVLVNNAGEGWVGRSWDTTEDQWHHSLQLNLMSAIRMTRLVVPHMQSRNDGRIINVASVSGHTMGPGAADYQTAKAGMIGFSKSMSMDLARFGILVNTVCPGLTKTALWDRIADSLVGVAGASREEVYANAGKQATALGRHGTVAEVAAVVVFLASRQASYVTGAAWDVDGGFTKSTF